VASLLSEIRYAALLAYSPRGSSDTSQYSREVCYAIKRGDSATIARAVSFVAKAIEGYQMGAFFGTDVVVVPVPRRAPLVGPDALWPSRNICEALVESGHARETRTYIERRVAVPKSAWSEAGGRPSVERHYDSIEVERTLEHHDRITVVDDVVTKGATLLASVARISESFPGATVLGFALVRTRGFVPDVERIVDPVVGSIRLHHGEAARSND
jgi:hypothetical protein